VSQPTRARCGEFSLFLQCGRDFRVTVLDRLSVLFFKRLGGQPKSFGERGPVETASACRASFCLARGKLSRTGPLCFGRGRNVTSCTKSPETVKSTSNTRGVAVSGGGLGVQLENSGRIRCSACVTWRKDEIAEPRPVVPQPRAVDGGNIDPFGQNRKTNAALIAKVVLILDAACKPSTGWRWICSMECPHLRP